MDKNEPGTLLMTAAMAEGFEEFMALIEIVNAYNSPAIGGTAGPRQGLVAIMVTSHRIS
jgi:hypothetical protein